MAGPMSLITAPILIAVLLASILQRPIHVLGIFRTPESTAINPDEVVTIESTLHCEDLHYHAASHEIFTTCESTFGTRRDWFPALNHFNLSSLPFRGNLQVIDTRTHKSRNLRLEGMDGMFVTHGIDVIPDPERPHGEAVYIFAVNHLPNPEHFGPEGRPEVPMARSVVEIFHHVIGSDVAKHTRTVWDPLVKTPNDIFAVSPQAFFVTNDHFYQEGLMKYVEIAYPGSWTDTIYVELAATPEEGVKSASRALEGLRNNNGLAHGRTSGEVMVAQAMPGIVNVCRIVDGKTLEVEERILMDSAVDNPTYFSDPFADETFDASGMVNCGATKGLGMLGNIAKSEALDPIMVWTSRPVKREDGSRGWETKLIFEDDGHRIRTCSTAVLVAIDPQLEGGRRRAWLYLTGFWSSSVIAVKVDL